MVSVQDILTKIADIMVADLKAAAIDAKVPPNSNLIKSIRPSVGTNTITIYANDYLKFVESGRKPNQKGVPVKVLKEWILRYNIAQKMNWKGTTLQLAYTIQKSIKRKGIKGKPLTLKAINKTEETINNYLDNTLSNSIETELQRIFSFQ